MPRADAIIAGIKENEGFNAVICIAGKPVNANKTVDGFEYMIRTKGEMRVTDWQAQFAKLYPGYEVQIPRSDGKSENGKTLLSTVRGRV